MNREIKGYKIFDKDFKAISGDVFEEDEVYSYEGNIAVQKRGFHFAKRLEDTLRYSNALKESVIIAEVTAVGKVISFSDNFYEYFDLYVTDKIRIDRVLTREEIIEYAVNLDDIRVLRFLSGIKLKPTEIRKFLYRSKKVLQTIDYYQFGNTHAFEKGTFLEEWKKVKKYGKYNNKGSTRK